MKILTLTAASLFWMNAATLPAQTDPRKLVKESIENYFRDYRAALDYTYVQRDQEFKTGADGKKTVKNEDVSEILNIGGTPYERLVARNGHPLSRAEERKQQQKYDRVVTERNGESPEQREKRIREYGQQRQFLHEVPEAFNFKLLGDDTVNGRPAYVVLCTPNPSYQPKNMRARMFAHIQAKLWIDKREIQWAKADAQVIDSMSIGFVVARIGQGAHIQMEQTRVADGVWLTKEVNIIGTARIMLVDNKQIDQRITNSGFKKRQPQTLAER